MNEDMVMEQSVDDAAPAESEPLPSVLEAVSANLVEQGRIGEADLSRAQRLAGESGEPLFRLLLRLGLVSERDLAQSLGEVLDLPPATAADYPQTPAVEEGISLRFMKDAHVVPLRQEDDRLLLAVADPTDGFTTDAVAMALGQPMEVRIGLPSEIDAAIERLYGEGRTAMGGIVDGMAEGEGESEEDIEHLKRQFRDQLDLLLPKLRASGEA